MASIISFEAFPAEVQQLITEYVLLLNKGGMTMTYDLFVETARLQEELLKLAPEDTVFIKKFINAYVAASDDLGSYLYDLNVELQNTLLIGLFPNKAPRRVPLDPKFKVISTEPNEMENLRKYFEEETDWGKNKRQTEQDILSTLP